MVVVITVGMDMAAATRGLLSNPGYGMQARIVRPRSAPAGRQAGGKLRRLDRRLAQKSVVRRIHLAGCMPEAPICFGPRIGGSDA